MIELVKNNTNNIEVDSKQKNIQLKKPSVIIDTELSTSSPNPVQNKVITNKINEIQQAIPKVDTKLSASSPNPVQNKIITQKYNLLSNELGDKIGFDASGRTFTSREGFMSYAFEENKVYEITLIFLEPEIETGNYFFLITEKGHRYLWGQNTSLNYCYFGEQTENKFIKSVLRFNNESGFFNGGNLNIALNKIGDTLLDIDSALEAKLGTENQIIYFTSKEDFINYPFEVGVLYNVNVPVSFDVIKSDSFYCIKENSGRVRLFSKTNNRKYVYEPFSGQRIMLCDTFFNSESEFFEEDNVIDNALNKLGNSLLGIDAILEQMNNHAQNIISAQDAMIRG